MRLGLLIFAALLSGAVAPAVAGSAAEEMILPPELPWDGKSRSLMVSADDPWITPSEKTGLTRTPRYDETVAWLQRLVEAAPELRMVSLGKSPEGRDLWMVIASREGAFTAADLKASSRPTVLAQAGIHAGEIDGKDAGLMLLRDMTVRDTRGDILDRVNLLFVPIFSVDGHERFSRFARINQRGPVESGWRVNARRLNLNRDYAKLDTPEMRLMIRAIGEYDPALYLDLHVTDGADYQYDITFGWVGAHGASPAGAGWMDRYLRPAVTRDLEAMGHIPGPLIFPLDAKDVGKGLIEWTGSPRFSTRYGDLRHLPTVLLENHSLKPYDQRVLGTYVFLESVLRAVGEHGDQLRQAIVTDRARRRSEIPLNHGMAEPDEGHDAPLQEFLMVEQRLEPSAISGGLRQEWTGRPVTMKLPWRVFSRPTLVATRPRAYWIPPAWSEVIERLRIHGIDMERIAVEREVEVEVYRIVDAKLEPQPFEGHARVSGTPRLEKRTVRFAPGSVRVPTDQPLGDLVMHLLEPEATDSFFSWGFFLEVLQPVEYVEGYVMEPMAERMLEADPALRAEFRNKLLNDPEFAGDSRKRLQWFYQKTPFFDHDWNVYPVAREN